MRIIYDHRTGTEEIHPFDSLYQARDEIEASGIAIDAAKIAEANAKIHTPKRAFLFGPRRVYESLGGDFWRTTSKIYNHAYKVHRSALECLPSTIYKIEEITGENNLTKQYRKLRKEIIIGMRRTKKKTSLARHESAKYQLLKRDPNRLSRLEKRIGFLIKDMKGGKSIK